MTTSKADKQRYLDETALLRVELNQTLDGLQEKLNVSKRIDEKLMQVRLLRREKPLVFAAGATGAAALVSLIVWGAVRYIMKCR